MSATISSLYVRQYALCCCQHRFLQFLSKPKTGKICNIVINQMIIWLTNHIFHKQIGSSLTLKIVNVFKAQSSLISFFLHGMRNNACLFWFPGPIETSASHDSWCLHLYDFFFDLFKFEVQRLWSSSLESKEDSAEEEDKITCFVASLFSLYDPQDWSI